MLLIIDNYDSFTYNLVQYFQCLKQEVVVYTHDQISINGIKEIAPDYLVISPGPKAPKDAGISMEAIHTFYRTIPILGICLGHQSIAQAFGGQIIPAPEIMHGRTSIIEHNQQRIFKNIPNLFKATRYHSLAVDEDSLPGCLKIDAWTNNTIMAISHRQYPVFGLQFHPEAILSQYGLQLLENFLHYETQSFV
ncbi:aminodeoxychorismate/anthranilate synthase component II [Fluoribacter dumoffii]|uniref:anthranilate synthase component II n=1 Tax=Fluoribacter dumoffii TaxID=463 RepID=UPI002244AE61|nr:aminodeoxychorismate/anthranilate synthase component II [Fluoribacter dumoffii]MCW8419104.1 aminodeoxychorismate/anthranilate synthase component II [Fluoribacter dumoffii]MCW8453052.1 aminodeoxychorismate/anthranilate synthase component II [Fluoribacter dumoffii]MCW8459730.1 aminodeoxychorismate/anthranilate synthase component II [Fluoribacter dumoffii]MCW8483087.1 aminodeoxychorismate/anthranilate synthase component II [Fluoribacter dumoffii]